MFLTTMVLNYLCFILLLKTYVLNRERKRKTQREIEREREREREIKIDRDG